MSGRMSVELQIAATLATMATAQPEALLGNDTEDGTRRGVGSTQGAARCSSQV